MRALRRINRLLLIALVGTGTVAGYSTSLTAASATKVVESQGPDKCAGRRATPRPPSNRADVIIGTDKPDTIDGKGGDDRICGGDGDDTLIGGKGNDRLFGEGQEDRLEGGPNDDFLSGGADDDGLDAREEAGLFGGSGNDALSGGNDRDLLDGGPDHDWLFGGTWGDGGGSDFSEPGLLGGGGHDYLLGGGGDGGLNLLGGPSTTYPQYDATFGSSSGDFVPNPGTDVLLGQDGNDVLYVLDGESTTCGFDGQSPCDIERAVPVLDEADGGDGNDVCAGENGIVSKDGQPIAISDTLSNTCDTKKTSGLFYLTLVPLEAFDWEVKPDGQQDFTTGQGAFGSYGNCPLQATVNTEWKRGSASAPSALEIRRHIDIPANAETVTVTILIDGSFEAFWNDQPIGAGVSQIGCPTYDPRQLVQGASNREHTIFVFDDVFLSQEFSENTLLIRATDVSMESFVDVSVTATLNPEGTPGD